MEVKFSRILCPSCPDLFKSSPHTKSISIARIYHKKKQHKASRQQQLNKLWNLSLIPDLFLCCLFSAIVQRIVRTWHHIQKRTLPLLNALTHPQSVGNTPCAGARSARLLGTEQKLQEFEPFEPRAFKQRTPCAVSCLMLRTRFMQQTRVFTSGSQMA